MPNINNQASKHEYEFNYNYLSTSELFEKFSAFAKQKYYFVYIEEWFWMWGIMKFSPLLKCQFI